MAFLFMVAIIIFYIISKEKLLKKGKKKTFDIANILFVVTIQFISLLIYYLGNISDGQKNAIIFSLWMSAVLVFALVIDFIVTISRKPINRSNLNLTQLENDEPLFSQNLTEPGISLDEMKGAFFTKWKLEFQCDFDQRKRLERAKAETIYRLFEINPNNGTAFCYSSTYDLTGEIYEVTYKHCTCPDFKKRFRPCKHIYALNLSLGIIDQNEDLYGIPLEMRQKLDSLPSNIAKYFLNLLKKNTNRAVFLMKRSPTSKPLFELELVKEYSTSYLLDKLFSRNDLVAKIYENKLNYQPSSKTTKDEIITYLVVNEPSFVKKIVKKDVAVTLGDGIINDQFKIIDYLNEKFESIN